MLATRDTQIADWWGHNFFQVLLFFFLFLLCCNESSRCPDSSLLCRNSTNLIQHAPIQRPLVSRSYDGTMCELTAPELGCIVLDRAPKLNLLFLRLVLHAGTATGIRTISILSSDLRHSNEPKYRPRAAKVEHHRGLIYPKVPRCVII